MIRFPSPYFSWRRLDIDTNSLELHEALNQCLESIRITRRIRLKHVPEWKGLFWLRLVMFLDRGEMLTALNPSNIRHVGDLRYRWGFGFSLAVVFRLFRFLSTVGFFFQDFSGEKNRFLFFWFLFVDDCECFWSMEIKKPSPLTWWG